MAEFSLDAVKTALSDYTAGALATRKTGGEYPKTKAVLDTTYGAAQDADTLLLFTASMADGSRTHMWPVGDGLYRSDALEKDTDLQGSLFSFLRATVTHDHFTEGATLTVQRAPYGGRPIDKQALSEAVTAVSQKYIEGDTEFFEVVAKSLNTTTANVQKALIIRQGDIYTNDEVLS